MSILLSKLTKEVMFPNHLRNNIVLLETLNHLLARLRGAGRMNKSLFKDHPLFMDSSDKIKLINEANDYNQHVLSPKFKLEDVS